MKAFPLYFSLLLILLYVCTGCNHNIGWEQESQSLMTEADHLDQEHLRLNARIDSLWDATTEALAKAIPSDFPPTDREIFLTARNAEHIRMFMSFHDLSPATQSMVDEAGKYDAMLATRIRDLQVQRQAFEDRKIQFLRKVSQEDPSAGQHFSELLRKTSATKSE